MIQLLASPLARLAGIALAFLAWTAYQRHDAARDARAECRADQLQATLEEVQRQKDVVDTTLADAEREAAQSDRELADLSKRLEEINANRNESSCVIPDDVLRRLRDIR